MRCRIIVRAQPGHKVEGPGRRFMRKASGFPTRLQNCWGFASRRRSRESWNIHIGKPEAFRTEGGRAAIPRNTTW